MAHPRISLLEPRPAPIPLVLDPEDEGRGALPLEEIVDAIDAIAASGAQWIVLGGPDEEPTQHPDLEEILWAAQERSVRAWIVTHGRRLTRRTFVERHRDAGLAHVTYLLYGSNAAVHDPIVGVEGAFEATIEAIRTATRVNSMRRTVRSVLLRENHQDFPALVALVADLANRFELARLSTVTRDPIALRRHGVSRSASIVAIEAGWQATWGSMIDYETEGFGTWPLRPAPKDPVEPPPVDMALLELLRANVPLPSIRGGTWATPRDGDLHGLWVAHAASRDLSDLGLQLAAYGCPALDLPPCLGGEGRTAKPEAPERDLAEPGQKAESCAACPNDATCPGLPAEVARSMGTDALGPLPTWRGHAPNPTICVLDPYVSDGLLCLSTLPGLAARLAEAGATVRLTSAWTRPFNPHDLGAPLDTEAAWRTVTVDGSPRLAADPATTGALQATPPRIAHTMRRSAMMLKQADLSGADRVVVPGFDNALHVLDNPTLPPEARVLIADFHLTTGLEDWHKRFLPHGKRPMEGGWWPDTRVEVLALYPRYVRAYWRAGIPLRQVRWIPYPLHDGHFPPGPDPVACRTLFSGGNHQRDLGTLGQAAALRAPGGHPIRVCSEDPVEGPVDWLGVLPLAAFYEEIASSRFVILPLVPDNRRPAGISVFSLALAAGRPIIASITPAAIDHLRDGENALLVRPNDPAALAEAIDRLDRDEALLSRLAAGARAAGEALGTRALAASILDGAPPRAVHSVGPRGPYVAW